MKINFRKCMQIILISSLSISCWEIGKKQKSYLENQIEHRKIIKEKENVNNIQEYLTYKDYDWINVVGTAIDYPLVKSNDNQFYLTHNHEGDINIAGAIFYDAYDEINNGNLTVIYGHSMKDGTMFNNLHFFPKDTGKFIDSELVISDEEKDTKYKPLGFVKYNGNDPFYRNLDKADSETVLNTLNDRCDYFIYDNYDESKHIIVLVTCEYSQENGRVAVFYIAE